MFLGNFLSTFTLFFIFIPVCFANNFSSIINDLKIKSYQTSPELLALDAKNSKSKANVYSSIGLNFPQLYLSLKRQKNFFESTSPLLQSLGLTTPKYQWGIDYQWSIYNYANVLNSKRSLKQSDIDEIDWENGKKDYDINFTTTFLNYVLSKYKEATLINSLKKAETAKKEATMGMELGQKTKIDVLRASANFISLSSKKITYSDETENTKNAFLEKSGLNKEDLQFLDQLSENEYLEIINSLSQYQKIITSEFDIAKSPVINKLDKEIELSNLEADRLTTSLWPELKIQGSYENSNNQFEKIWSNPSRSHSIALILSIPFSTGGNLYSNNLEQFYMKKQLLYQNAKNKRELKDTLFTMAKKVSALEMLVESLTINVSQFEELYRLTSKSYTLGKSTLFELLEVQDNLLESKINLATNKIQLYQMAEKYHWQTGLR